MTVLITGALWCAAAPYAARPDRVVATDNPRVVNQTVKLGSMADGAPFVNILTTNATMQYDEWIFALDGTNNAAVVGVMTWTNLLGGYNGELPAVSPWTIGSVWLEVGDNLIVVAGTNLAGIIAADTVTVTRLPEPMPVIAISNATQVLPFGTTNTMIGGCYSNIVQVMWWSNDRDGEAHMIPAVGQAGWFAVEIANLQPQTNSITVRGMSQRERPAEDRTTIIVDWPWPFVDILTTNATVLFDDWLFTIDGTNNPAVVGGMVWTNLLGGGHGEFPAVSPWTVGSVILEVGDNTIVVAGTNLAGIIAADTVTVTRLPEPMPVIAITNATQVLPAGTTNAMIGGCYSNIMEVLWWSNDRDGEEHMLNIAGQIGWFTAAISNLQTGTNTITVRGMSPRERPAQDRTTIIIDWPWPFVAITNAPGLVAYELAEVALAGTNDNLAGAMAWQVNSGAPQWFARDGLNWSVTVPGLAHGWNTVTVYGTNEWARWTNAMAQIYRQDILDIQPFVDILTTNATVPFDDLLCTIDGTNNPAVVGGMVWTNLLSGGYGGFPAVSPWTIGSVALEVGGNTIIVAGTNLMGIVAADTVTVTRLPEPLPVIAITNVTQVLPAGTTSALIGGCYSNIMEGLWWSNDRDGAEHMLPIAGPIGWFAAAITNLQTGTNTITVRGQSPHARYAQDRTTIIVDWPRPFVDILTTNATVPFDESLCTI
ncbi:MAG: hypothetical protein NTV22_17745, partial [bacterium]|nr:hypothetical protein [bacterium]